MGHNEIVDTATPLEPWLPAAAGTSSPSFDPQHVIEGLRRLGQEMQAVAPTSSSGSYERFS